MNVQILFIIRHENPAHHRQIEKMHFRVASKPQTIIQDEQMRNAFQLVILTLCQLHLQLTKGNVINRLWAGHGR